MAGINTMERRTVTVGRVGIGRDFVFIAGPCAVEDEELTRTIAREVRDAGAGILRGGAFKPRTSPYSFQGLEAEGLKILRRAGRETGLPVVTEVMDTRHAGLVFEYADMLQLGSRNMHNVPLLRELGRLRKPVLLKRGMSATLEEWLQAAETIAAGGNEQIVLCERGIRTFESHTKNTLDLGGAVLVRQRVPWPVIADPSHATGRADLIEPMSLAAAAAGLDGLMIEVHPRPTQALSDKEQQVTPQVFARIAGRVRSLREEMAREPLFAQP
jgi:3-deoxy-7-phosphoheptulonate synthase